MTTSTDDILIEYEGDGTTTSFATDFPFLDSGDLVVTVDDAAQTLGSNYSVTGGNGLTGSVVFGAAPADEAVIVIRREVALTQPLDLTTNDSFPANSVERALDRLTYIAQQLKHTLLRTLRVSDNDEPVGIMASLSTMLSKFLFVNSQGEVVGVSGTPSDPSTVLYQYLTATAGQTVVDLEHSYTPGANQLSLFKNRDKQIVDVDFTETDSDTITFLTPLALGDKIEAYIGDIRAITMDVPVKLRHDQTMSGGNQTVTISGWTYTPLSGQIEVWGNGALLRGDGIDYTEATGSTVTLAVAPPEGYNVAVLSNVAFSGVAASGVGRFAISDQEVAAGVTPSDYSYPWGHIFRYGAANDGSAADTAAFVAMLAAHPGSAYVPYTGTNWITGKLTIPSRTCLTLEPGVNVVDSGSLLVSESLLNITSASHVVINAVGATVTGYAYGTTPTARHNVLVNGGSNIEIRGLTAASANMDGIHVTGGAQNIRLPGCSGSSCGRDGIRIVSARGIRTWAGAFNSNTGCGIRVLPAATTDYVEGIRIEAPRCQGNTESGVRVDLVVMNSASRNVDIEIRSPLTQGNGADDLASGVEVINCNESSTVRGVVRVVDAKCDDELCAGIAVRHWAYNGPRVELVRPVVQNPNQSGGTDNDYHGGIILITNAGGTVTTPGNVRIYDPLVIDDDDNLGSNSLSPFSVVVDGSGQWADVLIENPESNATSTTFIETENVAGLQVTYKREKRLALTGASSTPTPGHMGMVMTNDGLGVTHTVALPSAAATNIGLELTYEVMEAQVLALNPSGSQEIRPGSGGAGYQLQSSTVGSRVTIRVQEAGYWNIVNQTGTWTSVV